MYWRFKSISPSNVYAIVYSCPNVYAIIYSCPWLLVWNLHLEMVQDWQLTNTDTAMVGITSKYKTAFGLFHVSIYKLHILFYTWYRGPGSISDYMDMQNRLGLVVLEPDFDSHLQISNLLYPMWN